MRRIRSSCAARRPRTAGRDRSASSGAPEPSRRRLRSSSAGAAALLASLLGFCAPASAGAPEPPAAEQNLPPVGRSLFDEIVRVRDGDAVRLEVPYPFPKLVALIGKRGGVPDTALRRVLIPLGRSLQRNGASPE